MLTGVWCVFVLMEIHNQLLTVFLVPEDATKSGMSPLYSPTLPILDEAEDFRVF